MTPGQEALAEAARVEAAKVYGTTCREPAPVRRSRIDRLIDDLQRSGPPVTDLTRRRASMGLSAAVRSEIETAIAYTGTVAGAVKQTGRDEKTVQRVWEAMSA